MGSFTLEAFNTGGTSSFFSTCACMYKLQVINTTRIKKNRWHMNSTFVCKFRLDFCGCAFFSVKFCFPSLYNNGPTSKFTAKAAPEALPSADSVNEAAPGTYGQSGRKDQGGDGRESGP